MNKQSWESRIDPDVQVHWCPPSDPSAVRGPQEFPLTGFDQAMPKVHARMSMYYKLPPPPSSFSSSSSSSFPSISAAKKAYREKIISSMTSGLSHLASQLPHLTATVTLDPVTKRGRLHTTTTTGEDDDRDGILFLVRGLESGSCPDLPYSYQDLRAQRFGPWMLNKTNTYPSRLINPLANSGGGHEGGLPACIFQVNFVGGGSGDGEEDGLILTAAFHHYVADGPSVDLIFKAWCGYARGEGKVVDMFTDRTRLIITDPSSSSKDEEGRGKEEKVSVEELENRIARRGCMVESTKPDPKNPWSSVIATGKGKKIKTAIITFPKDKIVGFKDVVAKSRDDGQEARVSTHDVLHALLWTGVVRAKRALLEKEKEEQEQQQSESGFLPPEEKEEEKEEVSYTLYPISFRTSAITTTTTTTTTQQPPTIPKNYIGNGTLLNQSSIPLSSLLFPSSSSHYKETLIQAALSLRATISQVVSSSSSSSSFSHSANPNNPSRAAAAADETSSSSYISDAMAWLSTIETPINRTWMTSPPRPDLDCGLTSWACMDYHSWDFGFGGLGGAEAMRPPGSPIPFLFPLGGRRERRDEEGEKEEEEKGMEEVLEAAIAAEEKVHEWLMREDEEGFGGFVRDYWVEP